MRSSRYLLLIAPLLFSSAPSVFCTINSPSYTLQVASFPDADHATRLLKQLIEAGEHPICTTVELEGRGQWTRVYIGIFSSTDAAQKYGVALINQGIIREFFVRKAEFENVSRPRKVSELVPTKITDQRSSSSTVKLEPSKPNSSDRPATSAIRSAKSSAAVRATREAKDYISPNLPYERTMFARLAPPIDTARIPRPDPFSIAFKVVGDSQNECFQPEGCGLWITGDLTEGLARLRWIVGVANTEVLQVQPDGQVTFNHSELEQMAGLSESDVANPMEAVNYISSNEGLLLLAQIIEGRHRYLLHIGRQTPTLGKNIETMGSVNLDNNTDSRINPYRKNGKKLDSERPPAGFDSLIGLNPVARWYNLSTSSWVQSGEIVFHELAEAYAKLEFGLDYLDHGTSRGAHNQALVRESRLKSQRPAEEIVVTAGSNRLLRSEEEIKLFYAESGGGNQR